MRTALMDCTTYLAHAKASSTELKLLFMSCGSGGARSAATLQRCSHEMSNTMSNTMLPVLTSQFSILTHWSWQFTGAFRRCRARNPPPLLSFVEEELALCGRMWLIQVQLKACGPLLPRGLNNSVSNIIIRNQPSELSAKVIQPSRAYSLPIERLFSSTPRLALEGQDFWQRFAVGSGQHVQAQSEPHVSGSSVQSLKRCRFPLNCIELKTETGANRLQLHERKNCIDVGVRAAADTLVKSSRQMASALTCTIAMWLLAHPYVCELCRRLQHLIRFQAGLFISWFAFSLCN